MSERRACSVIGADRSSVRYRSTRPDDAALRTRMRELAAVRRRFGYRRLHVLLRQEGLVKNAKRTQRLYREEGLTVRRRRSRKRATGTRAPILTVAAPNARWSVDFVHDQLADGRRLRVFNVVDDVTKECLAAVVDTSISGRRVARELAAIIARRSKPDLIVSDHGTEFTSNAMLQWTEAAGVAWHFIAPGKPMQNGICEAFNARMRDELLNETLFFSRPRPRCNGPMGRRLQREPPPFCARLCHPGGLRRPTHRNGRSPPRRGNAPAIACCSVSINEPNSPPGSSFGRMRSGGHSSPHRRQHRRFAGHLTRRRWCFAARPSAPSQVKRGYVRRR